MREAGRQEFRKENRLHLHKFLQINSFLDSWLLYKHFFSAGLCDLCGLIGFSIQFHARVEGGVGYIDGGIHHIQQHGVEHH